MTRILLILAVITASGFVLPAQGPLQTTAERSDYKSTSTYADVMNFTDKLLESDDYIRKEIIAVSAEGRDIPLFILADPMPDTPDDLKKDDRIVVYIQANIHAGEVEGKEASQMLMRDLLKYKNKDLFKNVVFLVCPILNADGNEKFSIKNRTNQVGPENGVGVRHNGQFLDLNRDAMKLETPEIRGVVKNVFNRWDPAITVDCHTTNGSYHEEPVTFTWMMNPNGDRNLINFMRDVMMPDIHHNLFGKYAVENVFYGEFIDRLNMEKGWISYAAEPRYLVNYVGLRNRLAILNENYVYADFRTRVNGCYHLLQTIVEYAAENKDRIKAMIEEADEAMLNMHLDHEADSFAIGYEGVPTPEKVIIKAFEADTIPGVTGYWRYKKSDRKRTVTVPYIADYYATESVALPYAYLLTVPDQQVLDNLETHGIEVSRLEQNIPLEVKGFDIEEITASKRLYQGHYTNTIAGNYTNETVEFPEGTHVIYTAQKLGNVAAYLLEPEADDGYVEWNFLDRYLVPQWGRGFYPYPVYKLMQAPETNQIHSK
jgi:hypothetical protein